MQLTIHQNIVIKQLRVDSVSNSSILQVGTAGSIKPYSQLNNSGGFTGPAPELEQDNPISLVPLPNPS